MPETTPMPSFLDGRPDPIADEARQAFLNDTELTERPWAVANLDDAEWAMRIYAEAARRIARHEAQAKVWRAQIDDWLGRATTDDRSRANRMSARLLAYAIAEREADPDRATIELPSGSLPTTFRREPVINISDMDDAIAWALKHHPDIVEQVPKLLVTTLRQHVHVASTDAGHVVVDNSGERVEGVEIDPPSITARVVPAS